ncbi:MAG: hypothetical protein ACC662_09535, partial [Planctomycetota bacterium]
MADLANHDVRRALDGVREAVEHHVDALLAPYDNLAQQAPEAVLGEPVSVEPYVKPAALGHLADQVEEGGRNAWALRQVERQEGRLRNLVEDYRRGRYRTTCAAEWTAGLVRFREQVLGDINTARVVRRVGGDDG